MGLFGVIHEAGHRMYEQNIDEKYEGTPVHEGASMESTNPNRCLMKSLSATTAISGQKQYPFFKNVREARLMMCL